MASETSVSSYLLRPVRTMRRVCMDLAEREGVPAPDCRKCAERKTCLLMERRHRREQKRDFIRASEESRHRRDDHDDADRAA